MEKDKIFFGEVGLTSTSANTIANMAKEYVRSIKSSLDMTEFLTTKISLISGSESILSEGITKDTLNRLHSDISTVSAAYSLIAWLREAIKARENLLKELNKMSVADYCEMKGIKYPELEHIEEPTQDKILTEDDYWASKSVTERNNYYQLQTYVATLGKFIHEDGTYANAKKELAKRVIKPREVTGNGRDTLIYHYTPTVSVEEVDDMYFVLQSKHRDSQKHLNKLIAECTNAIEKSATDAVAKYRAEYLEYSEKVGSAQKKFNDAVANLTNEYREYILHEAQKIRELKIIIPDSLKGIHTLISQLGK